jgi:hypothetical protein
MALAIALLISLVLAAYVLVPLLLADSPNDNVLPVDVTPQADLKRKRLVVYDNLNDLEFEYRAGKIASDDYQALRQSYTVKAAELLLASEDAGRPATDDTFIEQEVTARRARKFRAADEYVCQRCGFENPMPVKFCGECGGRLTTRLRKREGNVDR